MKRVEITRFSKRFKSLIRLLGGVPNYRSMAVEYYEVRYEDENGEVQEKPVEADNPGDAKRKLNEAYPEYTALSASFSHSI